MFREDFDWNNRFQIKDYVGDYIVSTVDLGLNHQFGNGPPLYYETIIFKINDGKVDYSGVYCDRYSTKEEAIEGHYFVIKNIEELTED